MTLSLSALKAARAAMTRPPALYKSDGHGNVILIDDEMSCVVARCKSPTRAAGIVATHNAADTLIEIAEAALAYQKSECTGTRCSHPAHRSPYAILATQDALEAALAKVTL